MECLGVLSWIDPPMEHRKLSRLKPSNHFNLCKYDLVCDDGVVEHVNDMSCDMRLPTF